MRLNNKDFWKSAIINGIEISDDGLYFTSGNNGVGWIYAVRLNVENSDYMSITMPCVSGNFMIGFTNTLGELPTTNQYTVMTEGFYLNGTTTCYRYSNGAQTHAFSNTITLNNSFITIRKNKNYIEYLTNNIIRYSGTPVEGKYLMICMYKPNVKIPVIIEWTPNNSGGLKPSSNQTQILPKTVAVFKAEKDRIINLGTSQKWRTSGNIICNSSSLVPYSIRIKDIDAGIILSELDIINNNNWCIEWWEKFNTNVNGVAVLTTKHDNGYGFLTGYSSGVGVYSYAASRHGAWDIFNAEQIGTRSNDQWIHRAICKHDAMVQFFENGKRQKMLYNKINNRIGEEAYFIGNFYSEIVTADYEITDFALHRDYVYDAEFIADKVYNNYSIGSSTIGQEINFNENLKGVVISHDREKYETKIGFLTKINKTSSQSIVKESTWGNYEIRNYINENWIKDNFEDDIIFFMKKQKVINPFNNFNISEEYATFPSVYQLLYNDFSKNITQYTSINRTESQPFDDKIINFLKEKLNNSNCWIRTDDVTNKKSLADWTKSWNLNKNIEMQDWYAFILINFDSSLPVKDNKINIDERAIVDNNFLLKDSCYFDSTFNYENEKFCKTKGKFTVDKNQLGKHKERKSISLNNSLVTSYDSVPTVYLKTNENEAYLEWSYKVKTVTNSWCLFYDPNSGLMIGSNDSSSLKLFSAKPANSISQIAVLDTIIKDTWITCSIYWRDNAIYYYMNGILKTIVPNIEAFFTELQLGRMIDSNNIVGPYNGQGIIDDIYWNIRKTNFNYIPSQDLEQPTDNTKFVLNGSSIIPESNSIFELGITGTENVDYVINTSQELMYNGQPTITIKDGKGVRYTDNNTGFFKNKLNKNWEISWNELGKENGNYSTFWLHEQGNVDGNGFLFYMTNNKYVWYIGYGGWNYASNVSTKMFSTPGVWSHKKVRFYDNVLYMWQDGKLVDKLYLNSFFPNLDNVELIIGSRPNLTEAFPVAAINNVVFKINPEDDVSIDNPVDSYKDYSIYEFIPIPFSYVKGKKYEITLPDWVEGVDRKREISINSKYDFIFVSDKNSYKRTILTSNFKDYNYITSLELNVENKDNLFECKILSTISFSESLSVKIYTKVANEEWKELGTFKPDEIFSIEKKDYPYNLYLKANIYHNGQEILAFIKNLQIPLKNKDFILGGTIGYAPCN